MMKIRMSLLTAVTLAALAGPAAARCNQPYAPIIKVNANSTKQDLASLRGDVMSYFAASDVYQACLLAAGNETLSAANQAEKQRVGREFNAAVRAFKGTHPD